MIVDTAGLFPEGKDYVMECTEVPMERVTRGTVFWDFTGKTEIDGNEAFYKESFPIWLAGTLFNALGFKEVSPGRYDVQPTMALQRRFKCDVVHEKIKDKAYARIKNAVPLGDNVDKGEGIPF
jgi:hypothetical protein